MPLVKPTTIAALLGISYLFLLVAVDDGPRGLRTSIVLVRDSQYFAQDHTSAIFGLAVAHCDEDVTWIYDIDNVTINHRNDDINNMPPYQQEVIWDATVYERCDKRAHLLHSAPQKNLGSEECSAYVQYIIDRYHEMPEIVYFLQSDALAQNTAKQNHQHTAFDNVQALIDASASILLTNDKNATNPSCLGYINLGNEDQLVPKPVVEDGGKLSEILDLLKERAPHYDDSTRVKFTTGACFVVHKNRILANPREFYEELMELIHRYAREDERIACWALEVSWHALFGEPLELPESSTLFFHLKESSSTSASTIV